MFNGFIQAFREIGGPAVEDGKVIENPETRGTEKPVEFDADGELTEEGFVAIGQSSFIYSANKYPHQGPGPSNFPALYPPLPSQPSSTVRTTTSHLFSPPSQSSIMYGYRQMPPQSAHDQSHHGQEADMIRGLPFILHPTLRQHISYQNSKQLYSRQKPQGNMTDFSYDFEFERRVLREINQQFGNKKQRWE